MYDVAIIGGGPAGLQAALTLGRMHRRAVLIDSGRYRNAAVEHMQNLVTHDGRSPAEFRAAARRDLERYGTVDVREGEVRSIRPGAGFELTLADGEELRAGRVILATGVADALPDIPGLQELFGTAAAHCPFCHGHEFSGTTVGLIGATEHTLRMVTMMRPIAAEIVVLAHGQVVDPDVRRRLERLGARVLDDPIAEVAPSGAGARVTFAGGGQLEVGGLLTGTEWRQAAPFAQDLGLDVTPVGAIAVDALGRTSAPRVYAAGDAAVGPGLPGPMHAVGVSIAAGLTAAAACVQDLVAEELAASA